MLLLPRGSVQKKVSGFYPRGNNYDRAKKSPRYEQAWCGPLPGYKKKPAGESQQASFCPITCQTSVLANPVRETLSDR